MEHRKSWDKIGRTVSDVEGVMTPERYARLEAELMDPTEVVLVDLWHARDLADKKWGRKSIPFAGASRERILTFLVEEVGEVAKALADGDEEELLDELLDVGQVVVAWLEREYTGRTQQQEG